MNDRASEAPTGAGRPRPWRLELVILLLAASAGLRLYGLDQGLDYDEIWSATQFFTAPWRDLFTHMPLPNHHPLYSLLAKLSLLAFGNKEWAGRLPAFIAGTLTPVGLYMLGSRWLNPRTGLIAGLITAFALWPVHYSQDARGYSLVMLLSIVATGLFLSLMEKFSWGRASAYAVAGSLLLYTHLYGGAVVGAHGLLALGRLGRKEDRAQGLRLVAAVGASLALAFLFYLPLLPDLSGYARSVGRQTAGRELSLGFVGELALRWSAGETHPYRGLPFLAVAAAGVVRLWRRCWPLAGTLLLSLGIGVLAPAALHTFVYHRFYAFALPWFYLAAAAAADGALTRWPWPGPARYLFYGLLAAAAVLPGLDLPGYYRTGKQGWRPAAEWVQANALQYRVLVAGMAGEVFDYYCPRAQAVERGAELAPEDLRRTVVVYSYPGTVGENNLRRLESSCPPPARFPAFGDPNSDVYVYRCE